MSIKSLSLGFTIPKISSETKTASKPKSKNIVVMTRATRVTPKHRVAFNWVPMASAASIAMVVGLLGFHLFAVNAYSGKGFELKRHQSAIKTLTEDQKRLVVQQAEMSSIAKVNDVATEFGLVPITQEEFVNTSQYSQR